MSFIYNMADTWNAGGTTYNGIYMNISNGAGGAPVGAAASRAIRLDANGSPVFACDISGNISNFISLAGVTSGALAAAGKVGEFLSSTVLSASAVSLTTATAFDITNLTITTGDWDVWGFSAFKGNAATTVLYMLTGLGTSSATIPSFGTGQASSRFVASTSPFASITGITDIVGPFQLNIATTTTLYLCAQLSFLASSAQAYGALYARRRR